MFISVDLPGAVLAEQRVHLALAGGRSSTSSFATMPGNRFVISRSSRTGRGVAPLRAAILWRRRRGRKSRARSPVIGTPASAYGASTGGRPGRPTVRYV